MAELVHLTAVTVIGGHRLHLSFGNGSEGVDLSNCRWDGIFEPCADSDYFR